MTAAESVIRDPSRRVFRRRGTCFPIVQINVLSHHEFGLVPASRMRANAQTLEGSPALFDGNSCVIMELGRKTRRRIERVRMPILDQTLRTRYRVTRNEKRRSNGPESAKMLTNGRSPHIFCFARPAYNIVLQQPSAVAFSRRHCFFSSFWPTNSSEASNCHSLRLGRTTSSKIY